MSNTTLDKLRELNPEIDIKCVCDPSFAEYGCVFQIDSSEMLKAAAPLCLPNDGTIYEPSVEVLEKTALHSYIKENIYGGMPVESGICNGQNTALDCLEYHRGTEVLIAVTDLVLLLAKKSELTDQKIDSSKVAAFYVPQGDAVGIYETSLHYAPCKVSSAGFRAIINLPKGTNLPLAGKAAVTSEEDRCLYAVNKWLVCHTESDPAKEGAYTGISGENIKVAFIK